MDNLRTAIRTVMKARGLNANSWGKQAGVKEGTLRAFMDGRTQSLRADTVLRLAKAANLTLGQLFGEEPTPADPARVWVKGLIKPGGIVESLAGSDGLYEVVPPRDSATTPAHLIAYEARGFVTLMTQDRWVLFFLADPASDIAELAGQACLVRTSDGRNLFRRLRRGPSAGRFNLDNIDGPGFEEDVEVIEAHRFDYAARPDIATS